MTRRTTRLVLRDGLRSPQDEATGAPGLTFLFVLFLASAAGVAHAETAFPTYDIEKFCRTQAQYSYAATLGDSSFEGVFSACKDREADDKAEVLALWPKAPAKLAAECLSLSDGRYSYLKRCVDGAREMRTAR